MLHEKLKFMDLSRNDIYSTISTKTQTLQNSLTFIKNLKNQ